MSRFSAIRIIRPGALALVSCITLSATTAFSADAPNPQETMKKNMALMTPELRTRVQALSPATKQALMKIHGQHNRNSDVATLRQVMHEVLIEYQTIASGIMTDNGEQTADAARRLANHRLPRGGLLPYLRVEDVTDEKVGALVPFNDQVEGSALKLADAAEKGDFIAAADHFNKMTTGCIGCHGMFRGVPGRSANLLP